MKRLLILILIIVPMLLTSCDAFRRLAGRPTSAQIQAIRQEIIANQNKEHRARKDSLRKIEKALSDSIRVLDSLRQERGTILNNNKLGGLFTTKLDYKYYIVIGAFKTRIYAEKLLQKVNNDGYSATIISLRNGFNVVAVCPYNDINSALGAFNRVKREKFCPKDAWILINE